MDAGMFANHFAIGCDHLSSNRYRLISLLGEIGFEKALIVAARDETNFLRIGLFSDYQLVLPGQFAHLGLGHTTERKQGATELLLRKAKQEISLIFRPVRGALQHPAAEPTVKDNSSVMPSGDLIGANLLRHNKKLVKLQVIVAQAARNGRATSQVL